MAGEMINLDGVADLMPGQRKGGAMTDRLGKQSRIVPLSAGVCCHFIL